MENQSLKLQKYTHRGKISDKQEYSIQRIEKSENKLEGLKDRITNSYEFIVISCPTLGRNTSLEDFLELRKESDFHNFYENLSKEKTRIEKAK